MNTPREAWKLPNRRGAISLMLWYVFAAKVTQAQEAIRYTHPFKNIKNANWILEEIIKKWYISDGWEIWILEPSQELVKEIIENNGKLDIYNGNRKYRAIIGERWVEIFLLKEDSPSNLRTWERYLQDM